MFHSGRELCSGPLAQDEIFVKGICAHTRALSGADVFSVERVMKELTIVAGRFSGWLAD